MLSETYEWFYKNYLNMNVCRTFTQFVSEGTSDHTIDVLGLGVKCFCQVFESTQMPIRDLKFIKEVRVTAQKAVK